MLRLIPATKSFGAVCFNLFFSHQNVWEKTLVKIFKCTIFTDRDR